MSVTLAGINLAGAVVGTSNPYDFAQVLASQSLPLSTQMNPLANAGLLILFNESNCGLQLTFHDSQHQINLPAGAWRRIPITASDHGFQWTVSYVIPNPLTTQVLIDYYRPGELIDEVGALGNSPIGATLVGTTQLFVFNPPGDQNHWLECSFDGAHTLEIVPARTTIPNPLSTALDWVDGGLNFHRGLTLDATHSGALIVASTVESLASITTATGSLGVPITPGLVFRQLITATTSTTILTYTPATTGFFRLSGFVFLNNGTSGNNLTIRVSYTDPDAGAGSLLFRAGSGTANGAFDGTNSFLNGKYPIMAMDFVASGGVAITVTYQDPTNTPSDTISMVLEQVA